MDKLSYDTMMMIMMMSPFVLDQHAQFDFYTSASSLNQQSEGKHVGLP